MVKRRSITRDHDGTWGPDRSGRVWPPRSVAAESLAAARAGSPGAARRVDVWTYRHLQCVVRKMLDRDASARLADEDAILSIAMHRVEAGRDSINDPAAYASWVSVVGRNAYLNYRRSRPRLRMVQEEDLCYDAEQHLEASIDAELVRESIQVAISRLPTFLQGVATMRLVEDRTYDAISAATGKPKPTVRSYVNKALVRLRCDETLKRMLLESRE